MADAIDWGQVYNPTATPAPKASASSTGSSAGIDWNQAYGKPAPTEIQKQAAANVAANPAQHVMNPLNPNNQIKQPATSFFSKVGSILGDIGTGLMTAANQVPGAIKDTFSAPTAIVKGEVAPSNTEKNIESNAGNLFDNSIGGKLTSAIAKPIMRAAEPIVEGYGNDISDILHSNEESDKLASEKPVVVGAGKQTQAQKDSAYLNETSNNLDTWKASLDSQAKTLTDKSPQSAIDTYNQSVDAFNHRATQFKLEAANFTAQYGKKQLNVAGVQPSSIEQNMSPLTPDDILKVIVNAASVGGTLAPIFAGEASALSLKLADAISENAKVPLSYSDMQKITASQSADDAIRSVGEEKYKAYQEATASDKVRASLKQGFVELAQKEPNTFANVLRNAATRPISEIANFGNTYGANIKTTTPQLLAEGQPEPFSNETQAAAPKPGAEPFSAEPGKVDHTLEPFTGAVKDQLPDKVIQTPEGFHTIPINAAPAVLSGLPDNITTKSPSQMEALGHENLGPVTSGQEGFVDPGQVGADIKAQLDKFKQGMEDTKAKEAVRTVYEGEKMARTTADNHLFDSLKNIVTNPLEQEALNLMKNFSASAVDKNGNPLSEEELAKVSTPVDLAAHLTENNKSVAKAVKFFTTANPKATPAEIETVRQFAISQVQKFANVIRLALNPSESMQAVNKAFTEYNKLKLAEGKAVGKLDSTIDPETYVPQHSTTPTKFNKVFGPKLGSKFNYGMERTFSNPLEAAAAGYNPKSLNIFSNYAPYSAAHAEMMAAAKTIEVLKANQLAALSDTEHPVEWEKVKIGKTDVYLPKNMADALDVYTDKDPFAKVGWFQKITNAQVAVKMGQVFAGIFHAKSLTIAAFNSPTSFLKAITDSDVSSPEFKANEIDMARAGMGTSQATKSIETSVALNKGTAITRGDLLKQVPGVQGLISFGHAVTDFTFSNLQRKYMVSNYVMMRDTWMVKNPHATPEQLAVAKRGFAKLAGAKQGEVNQNIVGIHKATRAVGKMFAFAPKYAYSKYLTGKMLFSGGTEGGGATGEGTSGARQWYQGPGGAAAKWFVASAVTAYGASQLMSLVIAHKPSKHPFLVYLGNDKNGKEMYANWFAVGAFGEFVTEAMNVSAKGFIAGTTNTLANQMSSIPRSVIQVVTNQNWAHQQITLTGAKPGVNDVRQIISIGKNNLPLPFWLLDGIDFATDKQTARNAWDYISGALGSSAIHQIPANEHVPTTGKNKGKVIPDKPGTGTTRPQKSFKDQLFGNTIYQPAKK